MKILVAGKGGVGKTVVAATLARVLARAGHQIVAVDADANPTLAIALGLTPDVAESIVPVSDRIDKQIFEHEHSSEGILATFGEDAPDGIRLLVANRLQVDTPG